MSSADDVTRQLTPFERERRVEQRCCSRHLTPVIDELGLESLAAGYAAAVVFDDDEV